MKTAPSAPLAVLAFAAVLLGATAAGAAPICVTRQGETVRCGTPEAMPVGWRLPASEQIERLAARPPGPAIGKLAGLAAFLAGIFALILLMPDFEGRWDRQELEDDERG